MSLLNELYMYAHTSILSQTIMSKMCNMFVKTNVENLQ